MEFLNNAVCPVSNVKINSYQSRVTVFLNASLIAAYLATGFPLLIAIVALDYGIRAVWKVEYSPLRWIAGHIVRTVNLPAKMTDQAPKLFASRVGFLFALASAIFFPISIMTSIIIAGVLLVFTILDSVFDFCVGCITYAYIVLPLYQYMGLRPKF